MTLFTGDVILEGFSSLIYSIGQNTRILFKNFYWCYIVLYYLLKNLLQTAKKKGLTNDYVIFLTLAYSGLRVGELCALKWKDFDFKEHTLSVTKTFYNPTNRATEYHLLTPKTSTSIRTIEQDPLVFKELEKLKARQNKLKMLHRDVYYDQDFVFAKTGKDMGYPEFSSNRPT